MTEAETVEAIAQFVDRQAEAMNTHRKAISLRIQNGETWLKTAYTVVEEKADAYAVLADDIRAGFWKRAL